jgi:uncharacterized membrane protein
MPTGSLAAVAVAVAVFVASHLLLSSLRVRTPLIAALGERGFRGGYSLLAVALLAWVVIAYNAAPVVELWAPPVGFRHLSLLLMPVACILLVAGLTTPNPTAVGVDTAAHIAGGPVGIFRVTRHPVMWAIALWGTAHVLANGDAAGLILFAGLTILAMAGAAHSDFRRQALLGERWTAYRARTSFIPFKAILAKQTPLRLGEIGPARLVGGLALFAALFFAHPWLFGVSPLYG